MDITYWDSAINYGVQLAQYCDQTLFCYAISRRFSPLCSLSLRLRNTKVPVWTHETIGYPKMDITYWDATIHYGIQLAQYCHQTRSCNALFTEIVHYVLCCPKTQEHQIAWVDSWVHRVPENGHQPLGRGIHYGVQLAQYCDQTQSLRYYTNIAPLCSLALRLKNTKVPAWTHESIG